MTIIIIIIVITSIIVPVAYLPTDNFRFPLAEVISPHISPFSIQSDLHNTDVIRRTIHQTGI